MTCSSGGALGSSCRLRCRPGWGREGRARWSCLQSGQWEEEQGRCAPVECPPLTLPPRLTVSPPGCAETSQSYKQKCRYSCPPGDSLRGSKVTFCGKKSKWVTRQGETSCETAATAAPTPPPRPQVPPPPPPASTAPPYILCPPDMKINLTGTDSRAEVSQVINILTTCVSLRKGLEYELSQILGPVQNQILYLRESSCVGTLRNSISK